jgi:hypothetical protein
MIGAVTGRPRDARIVEMVLQATRALLSEEGFGATTVLPPDPAYDQRWRKNGSHREVRAMGARDRCL